MKLVFEENQLCRALYGEREVHLRILEEVMGVSLHARGNELSIEGDDATIARAHNIIEQLITTIKKGFTLREADVRRAATDHAESNGEVRFDKILTDVVLTTYRNRRITPRNPNQKLYLDAIRNHDLVFGIGPAGTGKTYLAMAMAVAALHSKSVGRIILARPAVEAGERLGFLPGSLQEKVNPYLRPLYDALYDMLDAERVDALIERGTIEVAPLAFMRGRTLNNAFVILDEAQNTSAEQMKMFLTRLGHDSKAVVTGDATQIDLPGNTRSGLIEAMHILKDIDGIRFCHFDDRDVVRHALVQRIVRAYAKAEEQRRHPSERTLARHAAGQAPPEKVPTTPDEPKTTPDEPATPDDSATKVAPAADTSGEA